VLEGEREGDGDVPVVVVVVVAMLDVGRDVEDGVGVVLFAGLPRCSRPCLNGDSVADGEEVECLVGGDVCECGCRGDVCGIVVGGCERVGVAMPALSMFDRGGDSVPSRVERGGEGCEGSDAVSMAGLVFIPAGGAGLVCDGRVSSKQGVACRQGRNSTLLDSEVSLSLSKVSIAG